MPPVSALHAATNAAEDRNARDRVNACLRDELIALVNEPRWIGLADRQLFDALCATINYSPIVDGPPLPRGPHRPVKE